MRRQISNYLIYVSTFGCLTQLFAYASQANLFSADVCLPFFKNTRILWDALFRLLRQLLDLKTSYLSLKFTGIVLKEKLNANFNSIILCHAKFKFFELF